MGYEGNARKLILNASLAAGTYYYPQIAGADGYLKMDGYPSITAQIKSVNANSVITIEGTLFDTIYDGATATWVDITKFFTNLATGVGAAATVANTEVILQANGLLVDKIRFKIVNTASAYTVKIAIKRM